jgi:hypothetical protein
MNKSLIGGAIIGAAIVAGAFLVAGATADSPIEVADGSIELYFKKDFDVETAKRIRADEAFHRVRTIEVWDSNGASAYDTIDVRRRSWTITSADSTLTVSGFLNNDLVPIEARAVANITQVLAGDSARFRYDNGSLFTPATLAFTDGQPAPTCRTPVANGCTLSCPTAYCSVRLQYNFALL